MSATCADAPPPHPTLAVLLDVVRLSCSAEQAALVVGRGGGVRIYAPSNGMPTTSRGAVVTACERAHQGGTLAAVRDPRAVGLPAGLQCQSPTYAVALPIQTTANDAPHALCVFTRSHRRQGDPDLQRLLESLAELAASLLPIVGGQRPVDPSTLQSAMPGGFEDCLETAALIAHDLCTPLFVISSLAKGMLPLATGKSAEAARTIVDMTAHMDSLARRIPELARISQVPFNVARVDVPLLVQSCFTEVTAPLRERRQRIPQLVADVSHSCAGDVVLLRQLFQNLLSNAVKFSSRCERPVVRVMSRKVSGGVEFCVEDNGEGFDSARSDRLFQAFHRLHRQEDFAGHGLGLAMVRRIVERHAGRVWGIGKIGVGASFHVLLPE